MRVGIIRFTTRQLSGDPRWDGNGNGSVKLDVPFVGSVGTKLSRLRVNSRRKLPCLAKQQRRLAFLLTKCHQQVFSLCSYAAEKRESFFEKAMRRMSEKVPSATPSSVYTCLANTLMFTEETASAYANADAGICFLCAYLCVYTCVRVFSLEHWPRDSHVYLALGTALCKCRGDLTWESSLRNWEINGVWGSFWSLQGLINPPPACQRETDEWHQKQRLTNSYSLRP